MTLRERVADPDDPLRTVLEVARKWRVPPTVFMLERKADWWTAQDTAYALELDGYEAGLCPGGPHVLAETSKPEHAGAYRPAGEGEHVHCHHCKARALLDKLMAEKDADGIFVPIVLDPEIVALNKLPVPPLPPELMQPDAS